MSSRRATSEERAAITRRRLELLSAELASLRSADAEDPTTAGVPDLDGGPRDVSGTLAGRPPEPTTAQEHPPPRGTPVRGRHARRPVGPGGRTAGWVHDRLPPTLQGRVRLSPGHVVVVAVLVLLGLGVTGWWLVRADPGQTVPVAAGTRSDPPRSTPPPLVTPAAGALPSPTATDGATVVVDVAGKVRRPGIVSLPVGARVVDAIEAAGGPRQGVDLVALNLARLLVDGEQILVGVPPPAGVAAPAASAPGAAGPGGALVNLNSADQAMLEELPGVGPVTAAAILEWRSRHGPFTAVDELLEVSGIGEATLAEIAPHVSL